MDEVGLSLDHLARETIDLCHSFQGKNPFDDNQNNSTISQDCEANESFEVSELNLKGAGLAYRIQSSGSTFCLRGMAVDSFEDFYESMNKKEKDVYKALKLSEDEKNSSQVISFPMENRQQAQVVIDQLFNRRFPMEEDVLCNLSDPGFSLWFNRSSESFQIYFKSYGIQREENFLKLGPIADSELMLNRFKKSRDSIFSFFGFTEFSFSPSEVCIEVPYEDEKFKALCDIFEKGSFERAEKCFIDMEPTLYFYFKELAITRQFWLEVEKKLTSLV